MIELVMAGYLQCQLVHQMIVKEDLHCFYQCTDTTKEYASTLKQYSCPHKLFEDRPALPFKEQDRKGNRWTEDDYKKFDK
jgi:hypothetical protein|tara:strand:+ start:10470 stop:10709 length:240 start_codon:yes stop_codon:yes gene_type:complete